MNFFIRDEKEKEKKTKKVYDINVLEMYFESIIMCNLYLYI